MKLTIIAFVCFVLSIQICNVTADSESRALDIIKDYSNITRYTYFTTDRKLTKYPPGFCGGTPVDDCDWPKYAEAVLLLSGIPLLIGLICLCLSVVFWLGRSFLFGGCRPTHGFLCPGPKLDPEIGEGYTSCQVWALRIVVVIFAIAAVPLFITAMTGNSRSTKGINKVGDIIIAKADDTITQLQNITAEVNSTEFERLDIYSPPHTRQDIILQLQNITDEGVSMQKKANDIDTQAKKYGGWRNDIVLAGLIVGLVICIVAALSAICSIPLLSVVAALSLIIVLPFTWFVFSVHYPVNSLISDVCITFNSTGTGLSNFTNPLINEVFKDCQNQSNTIPAFRQLETLVTDLLDSSYQQACTDGIDNLCTLTFPLYPNNDYDQQPVVTHILNCTGLPACGNGTMDDYINQPIYDFQLGCRVGGVATCPKAMPCASGEQLISCQVKQEPSVTECQTDCLNPNIKNMSQIAVNGIQALDAFQHIWDQQVHPLIKCSNLMPFIEDVQQVACVEEIDSLILLISPTGLFAILMIGVGITSVLGQKRFNKKAHAQPSLHHEMA
ncbi:hypothetical protein PPL_09220 [Heterostelium album PN500]|uniref:Uncharacterized protein n=1 Tax=Heterostelium pallidum (strain ATCC 26659 / Pp 5 / PN500) TaxID=670386 RepID=D3BKY8_HETP5|nr:hypothetical protein PPL_09220 [Heterostelium album PN500]EFA78568.1 hypothetical protein PPL_09220 [Heterostelium album PN500]|eukprot:XP_020430692.1 hypothetical protein PPL_09220 [Heterostelium album PN500]